MADSEDIQPLVCDNGTGMVKVLYLLLLPHTHTRKHRVSLNQVNLHYRLVLLEMMLQGLCSQVL